ncbi:MAG: hypothetical protein GY743_22285 [Planctomycetaceae bacterium]|nr:hypothetical protein [Planctomycetaceae bacterium]
MYHRDQGRWSFSQELTASDSWTGIYNGFFSSDLFGFSIDMQNGRLLIGAPNLPYVQPVQLPDPLQGAAYLFEESNGTWNEVYRLRRDRENSRTYQLMGFSVGLEGNTALVSSKIGTVGNVEAAGAAEFFYLPMGASSCSAVPNSTGRRGRLEVTGFGDISHGFLKLGVRDLPANSTTLFLASQAIGTPVRPPGSNGNFCLAGSFARLNDLIGQTDVYGTLESNVPSMTMPTNPPITLSAGQTWHFQAWYREGAFASQSNFTQAVEVTFE